MSYVEDSRVALKEQLAAGDLDRAGYDRRRDALNHRQRLIAALYSTLEQSRAAGGALLNISQSVVGYLDAYYTGPTERLDTEDLEKILVAVLGDESLEDWNVGVKPDPAWSVPPDCACCGEPLNESGQSLVRYRTESGKRLYFTLHSHREDVISAILLSGEGGVVNWNPPGKRLQAPDGMWVDIAGPNNVIRIQIKQGDTAEVVRAKLQRGASVRILSEVDVPHFGRTGVASIPVDVPIPFRGLNEAVAAEESE